MMLRKILRSMARGNKKFKGMDGRQSLCRPVGVFGIRREFSVEEETRYLENSRVSLLINEAQILSDYL